MTFQEESRIHKNDKFKKYIIRKLILVLFDLKLNLNTL